MSMRNTDWPIHLALTFAAIFGHILVAFLARAWCLWREKRALAKHIPRAVALQPRSKKPHCPRCTWLAPCDEALGQTRHEELV